MLGAIHLLACLPAAATRMTQHATTTATCVVVIYFHCSCPQSDQIEWSAATSRVNIARSCCSLQPTGTQQKRRQKEDAPRKMYGPVSLPECLSVGRPVGRSRPHLRPTRATLAAALLPRPLKRERAGLPASLVRLDKLICGARWACRARVTARYRWAPIVGRAGHAPVDNCRSKSRPSRPVQCIVTPHCRLIRTAAGD